MLSWPRHTPRVAALAVLAGAALSAAGTTGGASSAAPVSRASAVATAGGFLVPAAARGRQVAAPRTVVGESRLVTLRTGLLPREATGQRIAFDVGRLASPRSTVTGRVQRMERTPDWTSWTGPTDEPHGSFTIVRAGDTVRASVTSPQGQYAVTQAQGDLYWLTEVTEHGDLGDDAVPAPVASVDRSPMRTSGASPMRTSGAAARRTAKITVLFGYTGSAKAAAGSKAGVKAAAGMAVTDTNTAFANSGIKAQLRYKGLVRTKGQENADIHKDYKRLYKVRDGHFDNLRAAQQRKRADLVHLLTGGTRTDLCGIGSLPRTTREVNRMASVSTSYMVCVNDLVPTHEIAHNLGADHNSYPGVSHDSRLPGAYAYADVANRFITVMSYFQPCGDAGVHCTRVPWFSNPATSYNGLPVGSAEADNARVISKIAPRVARYR